MMTSTTNEEKGVLIDAFNFEGKYIDNFYLKFSENIAPTSVYGYIPTVISEDFLHIIERDEDKTYEIKKQN